MFCNPDYDMFSSIDFTKYMKRPKIIPEASVGREKEKMMIEKEERQSSDRDIGQERNAKEPD